MQPKYLLKSEPDVYSIDQLKKDKKTNWDHIRNYQARNNLKEMQKGDVCMIYHSGDHKALVGLAECIKTAYPEEQEPDWVQVDIRFLKKFETPLTLAEIKAAQKKFPLLKEVALIKQSRLSVSKLTKEQADCLLKLIIER